MTYQDKEIHVPGIIQYTGTFTKEITKIHLIQYRNESYENRIVQSLDEIKDKDKEKCKWLNVSGLNEIDTILNIGDKYGINKLVLEDIVHVSNHSKIEIYDTYIFAVFKMLYVKNDKLLYEHVSMILCEDTLFTFQETEGDVFDEVRERIKNTNGAIRNMGADYLFYSLIDAIIDNYFIVVNKIGGAINELEDKILDDNGSLTNEIYEIRREILKLTTSFVPIKEILNVKKYKETSLIDPSIYIYFEDLRDHMDQIVENISIYKETINGLYEMHVANISNKMNAIMTTLTIFSAIFIPLSFLAGVFGMNFSSMPGIENSGGFYIFVIISVVISALMIAFFKKRKWF